jgi:hypothetical protein
LGTVYEWVNPPENAHSEIYIDSPIPDNAQTIPIEGALITLDYKTNVGQEKTSHLININTDNKGAFRNSIVVSEETFVIKIQKQGYVAATSDLVSSYKFIRKPNYGHKVICLLVKEK